MNITVTDLSMVTPERCDRCGARAKVRAVLDSGADLHFCGHHARQHESRLRELQARLNLVA
jgi:hypothetical protein